MKINAKYLLLLLFLQIKKEFRGEIERMYCSDSNIASLQQVDNTVQPSVSSQPSTQTPSFTQTFVNVGLMEDDRLNSVPTNSQLSALNLSTNSHHNSSFSSMNSSRLSTPPILRRGRRKQLTPTKRPHGLGSIKTESVNQVWNFKLALITL